MRILFVWLTAVAACFIISAGWYISLGLTVSIVDGFLGSVTGQALSLSNLVQYCVIAWGPVLDIAVVVWAIVSSQAEGDWVSRYR